MKTIPETIYVMQPTTGGLKAYSSLKTMARRVLDGALGYLDSDYHGQVRVYTGNGDVVDITTECLEMHAEARLIAVAYRELSDNGVYDNRMYGTEQTVFTSIGELQIKNSCSMDTRAAIDAMFDRRVKELKAELAAKGIKP